MKSGVEELAQALLSTTYTTTELKQVSVALESLSQSKSFKNHANEIVSDPHLTNVIRKKQLLLLLEKLDIPLLLEFISDLVDKEEYWVFSNDKFDYFDEFVQTFQLLTEKITIVNLVTAIEVEPQDYEEIAKDLSEALETQVVIHPQINPSILGGAQMRIGNLVFDYSIRSKFHQFQRQWLARIEKTSELVGRE